MDPFNPPVSVLLALWAPVPSSYGPGLVQDDDAVHEVVQAPGAAIAAGPSSAGLDDPPAPMVASGRSRNLPLETWLSRHRPLLRSAAVLARPADPLPGLGAIISSGQGVIVHSAGSATLLVPQRVGTNVVWQAHDLPACPPPFDASHARRQVHRATEEAIDALNELDLAQQRPDLADALTDLITARLDPRLLPPWLDPRRLELLERSLRLGAICELALEDDGAAVSSAQSRRRRETLRPLAGAARLGVAAATDWWRSEGG